VTLTQAGTFASQNVGTAIGVTATDSLGGSSAGNYTLTEPVGLAANITSASPPVLVPNVVTEVDSILPSPQTNIQLAILDLAPTVAMTLGSNALASASTGEAGGTAPFDIGASTSSDDGIVTKTRATSRAMIPTLHVVNGGVKLPEHMVGVNE
jgi:hypothetical protein